MLWHLSFLKRIGSHHAMFSLMRTRDKCHQAISLTFEYTRQPSSCHVFFDESEGEVKKQTNKKPAVVIMASSLFKPTGSHYTMSSLMRTQDNCYHAISLTFEHTQKPSPCHVLLDENAQQSSR